MSEPEDTIWYTRCPLPTAFSVAVHTGLLAQKLRPLGVQVESLRHSDDPQVRLSHFTHTWPGMMRQGGHIPPLWSRSQGRDVRLIGLSWTDEAQFVLTLPGRGITTVEDLRGRRMAVPLRPNFPIDFWRATVLKGYADALATVGLTLADVVLVDILVPTQPFAERAKGSTARVSPPGAAHQTLSSQSLEAAALVRGEVDALFSPGHYGVALRAFLGAQTVVDVSRQSHRLARVNNPSLLAFTVDGRFLDANRPAVAAVLAGALEGAERARRDPREAARIVAAESGNAEELVEEIFGAHFAEDLAPRVNDELLEALAQQNHFLHQQGFIPRQVPIAEWLDTGPLEEAHRLVAAGPVHPGVEALAQ